MAPVSRRRALFDCTGGFDESFTNYGGEDWEWAYRAWLAGAVLAHVPGAVAWHDGPDSSGRTGGDSDGERRQQLKNAEVLRLTEPGATVAGVVPGTSHDRVRLDIVVERPFRAERGAVRAAVERVAAEGLGELRLREAQGRLCLRIASRRARP